MPPEFAELIFHAFSADDLKAVCREHNLKGFSRFKKAELVPFILTSLAEEELGKVLAMQGLQVIEKTVDLAAAITTGTEVREKLREVADAAGVISLDFKGLQWTQSTTIRVPSEGIVIPPWTCTCRTALDGGICPHFYIAATTIAQLKDWNLNSLPPQIWPKGSDKKFSSFQARSLLATSGGPAAIFSTPEEILRGFFLEYGSNDTAAMERRSKEELLTFARSTAPDVSFDSKWTKNKIITALLDKFGEEELAAKFRKDRQDQKIVQADEYIIDIKDLQWSPVEIVVANLQRMESHDITVEGTKVTHECDGWRNIRPKFCTHLLALFLELGRRDAGRTLNWLKKLAKT